MKIKFMLAALFLSALCPSLTAQKEVATLRVVTRLPSDIMESSGVAVTGSNLIWSHEDSGNENKIFGFDTLGHLSRTITLSNASNVDWEDLASDEDGNLFVADLGNNSNTRTDLVIYKIPDPSALTSNSVAAEELRVTFADQTAFPPPPPGRNFDVEAVLWHQGSLFLFTKDRSEPFSGITKMYKLADQPGTYLLMPEATLFTGSDPNTDRVTSADCNRATGEMVLLTHNRLISFTHYPSDRFFEGTMREYFFNTLPGQNEAIAFVTSKKLYMTEEGASGTGGHLYQVALPTATGIQSGFAAGWSLSPNPASDCIRVEAPVSSCRLHITLVGITGTVVLETHVVAGEPIPVAALPSGCYLAVALLGQQVVRLPFVKL